MGKYDDMGKRTLKAFVCVHARVLDIRHACHIDINSIMALPALRLLATHVHEHLVGRSHWKLHRKVDMVAAAEADGWPQPQNKRSRLQNAVLLNTKRSGAHQLFAFVDMFSETSIV